MPRCRGREASYQPLDFSASTISFKSRGFSNSYDHESLAKKASPSHVRLSNYYLWGINERNLGILFSENTNHSLDTAEVVMLGALPHPVKLELNPSRVILACFRPSHRRAPSTWWAALINSVKFQGRQPAVRPIKSAQLIVPHMPLSRFSTMETNILHHSIPRFLIASNARPVENAQFLAGGGPLGGS